MTTIDTESLVSLDELRVAAARVAGVVRRTPLLDVEAHGRVLWLKCENLQPVGAFKLRGAFNMIAQLAPHEARAGVITYSSGNHGLAVAYAARQLGIHAVIVVPETVAQVKVDGIRRLGAEVVPAGRTSVDRRVRAEAEAAARGLVMVPPFDHRRIIAGAGSLGLEILDQKPDVATVFVPLGGGGLASGVSAAIKRSRRDVRVVGVEPAGAAKMTASLAGGGPVTLEGTESIADGLLALRPGDLTFAHVRAFVDEVMTVDDRAIAAAVRFVHSEARVVAEPSGATAVAGALVAGCPGTTVAVISGGNVDVDRYVSCLTS